MTAPARQKKHDRLTYGGASAEEVATDFALGPFDAAMRNAEATWGIDRLPDLVSTATAAKFGSAMAKMNAAIAACDPTETVARAAVCIRGIAAMDAEARAAGHAPIPPEAWPVEVNGKRGFLIRDAALWPVLAKDHPGATVWTLGEVTTALAGLGNMVAEVKAHFDAAQVAAIRPRTPTEEALNDTIPF